MQHAMQIHVNVIEVSPVQMQHAMQTVIQTVLLLMQRS
jgi:hypothetical protein